VRSGGVVELSEAGAVARETRAECRRRRIREESRCEGGMREGRWLRRTDDDWDDG
jgi:hypothetical protein